MRTILLAATLLVVATGPALGGTGPDMCEDPPCSRREIEAYERRVTRHMLRVQQARFEALARGEKEKTDRYDREYKRTQQRRIEARRALESISD
jgi:hypothetical protein